jgi:hypothetical protein
MSRTSSLMDGLRCSLRRAVEQRPDVDLPGLQ